MAGSCCRGTITRDGIFADRLQSELATVSGDPATGLSATFQVLISA